MEFGKRNDIKTILYIIIIMANQFIQETNQVMLWKIVNSTQQIADFFTTMPQGTKEEWFKGIIRQVYGEINGDNSVSLRTINKRALDYMLESIQAMRRQAQQQQAQQQQAQQQQRSPTQQAQQQQRSPTQQAPTYSTPHNPLASSVQSASVFRETRESSTMEQFNRRQAEYDSMTKKTTPVPVFNDSIKDEAIQDINQAVNEYKNMRDVDLQQILPRTEGSTDKRTEGATDKRTEGSTDKRSADSRPINRIQISDQQFTDQYINDSITISLDEDEPASHKKQVQWGENSEHIFDKSQSIYETALMKKIQTLEDKIDELGKAIERILLK